jgi:class 3 adenylate cyclase
MDFELMDDPHELARFRFFDAQSYSDLLAVQQGNLSEEEFDKKYLRESAILCLNMSGLTQKSQKKGSLACLISILDMHKLVAPVLRQYQATHIRAFADDFIALFGDPESALNVAAEIQHRLREFNHMQTDRQSELHCGIGIGCGNVYNIGIDHAMGDEMNQASKLGKNIARSAETLITERVYSFLRDHKDCTFIKRMEKNLPFVFYEVVFRSKG